ncbi:MAG: hypothetical protein E6G50_15085, partial [Actinobacteria bacterium]
MVVPETALTRLLVAAAAVLFAATLPSTAHAAPPSVPIYDSHGRIVQTPFAPPQAPARLTEARAKQIFLADDKVADWLGRYPQRGRQVTATYEPKPERCTVGTTGGCWNLRVDWSPAGEIASGRVDDRTGRVTEAWTGPQVAWKMARGGKGAFGGVKINSYPVWLGFCFAFLLGLAEFRRPLSWRPLAYPFLLYVIVRMMLLAFGRGRPRRLPRPSIPVAWLAVGVVFLMGFRIGLNVTDSNVIDVGYAGVIGAERIASGQSPYCHFPVEAAQPGCGSAGSLKPCGGADSEGEIRDRIQADGRCESANPQGDTYGPVSYEAYLPGYWIRG